MDSRSGLIEWISKQIRSPGSGTGDAGGMTTDIPCTPLTSSNAVSTPVPAGNPSVNFHFVVEKLAYNIKRRYENQVKLDIMHKGAQTELAYMF
jgi:hypothetical protein